MGIFATIPTGGIFTVRNERYKKTGPNTYESLDNPILGEYTMEPFIEARIKVNTPPPAVQVVPEPVVVPAPVKKAVARKPVKKAKAKVTKKPVKKTVAKKTARRGK
jgi:hypothetical protein